MSPWRTVARNAPTVQADDVHAVIDPLDAGPDEMFASSGDAVSALALVVGLSRRRDHPGGPRAAAHPGAPRRRGGRARPGRRHVDHPLHLPVLDGMSSAGPSGWSRVRAIVLPGETWVGRAPEIPSGPCATRRNRLSGRSRRRSESRASGPEDGVSAATIGSRVFSRWCRARQWSGVDVSDLVEALGEFPAVRGALLRVVVHGVVQVRAAVAPVHEL
jgi:hypothetical protein